MLNSAFRMVSTVCMLLKMNEAATEASWRDLDRVRGPFTVDRLRMFLR
jgi:hypothetical protein